MNRDELLKDKRYRELRECGCNQCAVERAKLLRENALVEVRKARMKGDES